MSALTVETIEALCALPEHTQVTDAKGVTSAKRCGGKPTTNPNWIFWDAAGVKLHSDQVALPATVADISPNHEHVWEVRPASLPQCACEAVMPRRRAK